MEAYVLIVILNYNRVKDTKECLESLTKLKYKNFDVVVVDNGSREDETVILKSEFPEFKYIRLDTNLGFSGGNNLAVEKLKDNGYDYFLFLNNDTVVKDDFLDNLTKGKDDFPGAGIFAPILYHYSDREMLQIAEMAMSRSKGPIFSVNYSKELTPGASREADILSGCCLLVKKEVMERMGGFDEDYFLYLEDADLCSRAVNAGFKLALITNSVIWHKGSVSSSESLDLKMAYYLNRNLPLFFFKNYKGFFKKIPFLFFFLRSRPVMFLTWFMEGHPKRVKYALKGIWHFLIGKRGPLEL